MASTTFLDELASLCLDLQERAAYRQDPSRWLRAHRCGHLCGEDVAAAVLVLRSWLPVPVGSRLALNPPTSPPESRALSPAPGPGETELDAAIRLLNHLLAGLD